MKAKRVIILVAFVALLLAACAASGGEQTTAPPAGGPEATSQPVVESTPVEAGPTSTPEMSDVPVFEGALDYKSTGNGTYISYNVPDVTTETVIKFYQEQLASLGWEQKNKKDTGFGDSITLLRSKPDKNISVTIDANAVINGVRVLITLIPK